MSNQKSSNLAARFKFFWGGDSGVRPDAQRAAHVIFDKFLERLKSPCKMCRSSVVFGMRVSLLIGCLFFLISLGSLSAEQLPDMRPALVGTGPKSLINLIDTQLLMKQGQTDAMVMFSCSVNDFGYCDMITYGGTPNSKALAEEAVKKSEGARFIPAVYKHKNSYASVYGTIIFRVINGKPRLRIYLTQEKEHLLREDGFISPQPVYFQGQKFKGIEVPNEGIGFSATVEFTVTVDATGKLKGTKVIFESPPGRGFGSAVMSQISDVTFLPGYLNGKPVACSATMQTLFKGPSRGFHWKSD